MKVSISSWSVVCIIIVLFIYLFIYFFLLCPKVVPERGDVRPLIAIVPTNCSGWCIGDHEQMLVLPPLFSSSCGVVTHSTVVSI